MLFVSLTSAERKDLNDVGSGCFVLFCFFIFFLGTWRWLLDSFVFPPVLWAFVCQDFLFRSSLERLPRLHIQSYLRVFTEPSIHKTLKSASVDNC